MPYDEFDYRMAHQGRPNVMEQAHKAAAARNAPDEPAPDRPGPIGGRRQPTSSLTMIILGVVAALAIVGMFALRTPPAALPDVPDVPAIAPVSPWVAPALDPAPAPAPAAPAPEAAPAPVEQTGGYLEPVNAPAPAQAAPAAPVEAPPAPAPVVYNDLIPLPEQAPEAPGWHAPMAPGYDPGNYVVNPEARP